MNAWFSTATAAGLTGASVRQVGYWADTGLLKPSAKAAAGKGSKRRYTFQDLVALLTIRTLRARGCPLQKVRTAIKYLKKHYPTTSDAEVLSRLTLMTDGRNVYMFTDEHDVMEVVSRQHVWSIALGQLILKVENQVKALPTEWVEKVRVGRRMYSLTIVRDGGTGTHTAQCRELPGAIEQGDTAEEAVANGKEAIRSALAFIARRRSAGARHVEAG